MFMEDSYNSAFKCKIVEPVKSAPAEGSTRMPERCSLLFPHAALAVGLPVSVCSHSFCPPYALLRRATLEWWGGKTCLSCMRCRQSVLLVSAFSPQYPIMIVRGYGGSAPMIKTGS